LPTESDDTEDLDEKVANINSISDVTLDEGMTLDDDDLAHDRTDYVWAIISRLTSDNSDDDDDEHYDAEMKTDDDLDNTLRPYDVQQLQESCPDCRVFLDYFRDELLPQDDAGACKTVYQAERFVLDDGVLFHLDLPRNRKKFAGDLVSKQLMVPQSLRKLLLRSYHENLSHIGSEKMYNTIREKYFWPHMFVDAQNWTKTCIECQTGKTGAVYKAPLRPLSPPVLVFDTWHLDHISLLRSKGYQYALVLVDSISLFSIILFAKTCGADKTARLLYDNLFMMFGAKTLLSDRGSAFKSKLLKALCALLGTKQKFTSSRHPQTNSRAESFNKNILNSLRTQCNLEKEWPAMLSSIAFSFRTSVVKSLGITPYELVFGLKPRLPVDNLLLPPKNLPKSAKAYFEKIKPQLEILHQTVRENQLELHLDTKQYHAAKTTVRPPTFKVGDRVWLLEPTVSKVKLSHKVQKKFIGPFLVLEAYPEYCTFKLQNCATQKILPSLIHSDRLKLCDSTRDDLFSKYTNATDTVTDTAMTTEDAVSNNTRFLTDNGKIMDNSLTTSLRTNGNGALLPSRVSTQDLSVASRATAETATMAASEENSLASDSSTQQAAKQRKLPVRIFTRTTKRAQKYAAGSNTRADGSTTAATAVTNNSRNAEGRDDRLVSTTHMSAPTQHANMESMNGQTDNSAGKFPGWYEITRILSHQRRERTMFYKILWQDGSTSWIPEKDVTKVATDGYWLSRYE